MGPGCSCMKLKANCKAPFSNVCTQWATNSVLRAFAQPVTRAQCQHESLSYQAHTVHMFKKHCLKSDHHRCAPCTRCLVCLRKCHTRENCSNHVRHRSKVCLSNLLIWGPIVTTIEANKLDDARQDRHRELHANKWLETTSR